MFGIPILMWVGWRVSSAWANDFVESSKTPHPGGTLDQMAEVGESVFATIVAAPVLVAGPLAALTLGLLILFVLGRRSSGGRMSTFFFGERPTSDSSSRR